MKKTILFSVLLIGLAATALSGLPVTDFSHTLDNGMRVRVERGWIMTNAEVSFSEPGADKQPEKGRGVLSVRVIIAGDTVSNAGEIRIPTPARLKLGAVILTNGGTTPGLPAGKYSVSFRYPNLDGKGSVSFKVPDVPLKQNTRTELTLVLQNVQVRIESRENDLGKLSEFGFFTFWTKDRDDGGGFASYPTFFPAKARDQIVTPLEMQGDEHGKIKPGSYDVYLDTDISRAKYRYALWIDNVNMEPDRSYKFFVNLNTAKVETAGGDAGPKSLHFYLPGAAQKIGSKLNKKKQVYFVEGSSAATMCPPGRYDLLMVFEDGRLEWRENVSLKAGEVTKVK